jgi:hypothetical protein
MASVGVVELSVWADTSTVADGSAIRIVAIESSAWYELPESRAVPGAKPTPGTTPAVIFPAVAGAFWDGAF